MKIATTVTLVVGLTLGALPHAFCDCGCARTAPQPAAAPGCHRCCGGRAADPSPEKPQPCQCRQCQVVKAVSVGGTTSVPSSEPGRWLSATPTTANVQLDATYAPEGCGRVEPTGGLLRSGCALTIFLGHLLL